MDKRIIIITGSRKGIGKYLSEYYLRESAVVIGCSRKDGSIRQNNYIHYKVDVSDEIGVVNMIKEVVKRFKRVDILINNAGIAAMNHIMLTPMDTATDIIKTNLLGTFIFIREVSKVMARQKWGRIVNISTIAVPLSLEGESIYVASKAAVENLTKIASRELASFNITVNTIGIAPLMTDLIKTVPKEKINKIISMMGIKRLAKYSDVSNVIDFYIKDESDYISGQNIYLGGIC
jgi:3-oxoacyl-[acyl-carrier protein] reductase